MTSVQERLKLKRAPTDIWSIREQLCLASSVLKSGDQNWMSVSRSIKPIADKDSIRSPEWFSQKSCAQQYAYLLENTDIPKRKKRESGETTSELIVRRLTEERMSELTKILVAQREEYQQLKNEICLLKNGVVSDEKLQKMWLTIEQEEKEKEKEQNNTTHMAWLAKQQNKEVQLLQTNVQCFPKKLNDASTSENQDTLESTSEEEKKSKTGRSSLLTSLLKSPSPTIQTQIQTQVSSSPTIASLLCSSPKVPGPVIMQNMSSPLHQLVLNTSSNAVQERPSVSAPTLSMLLEQPSAGTQKALQQQLQNATHIINNKNLQNSVQIQNAIKTKSAPPNQESNSQIHQVQHAISTEELSGSEISQIISNPIDEVMPKVMQMDKDEINEIIGDIEELIKEEITGSPQTPEQLPSAIDTTDNEDKPSPSVTITERLEPRNVDEPISLSNSPVSEISIEEIDSSTSNIAEIIGTAIEPIETKISTSDVCKDLTEPGETKIQDETLYEQSESLVEQPKLIDDTVQENNSEVTEIEESNPVEEPNTDKEIVKETQIDQEENNQIEIKEEILSDQETDCRKENEHDNIIESETENAEENIKALSQDDTANILSDEITEVPKQEREIELFNDINRTTKNEKSNCNLTLAEEKKAADENTLAEIADHSKSPIDFKTEALTKIFESRDENSEEFESTNSQQSLEKDSSSLQKSNSDQDIIAKSEKLNLTNDEEKQLTKESVYDSETKGSATAENTGSKDVIKEIVIKKEVEEYEETEESSKNNTISNEIKIELKTENIKENEEDSKQEKDDVKTEIESVVKKENPEPVEELDEEEPTLSKLSGGRAMKTYSKKQNATVDSETENENSGETADYRAWKKSIMLVYNRLATHKYASVFLRPITEDQAPGYHSIIFRPMDLWTIKKNIDNGTIRSTTHFQRDVMLMFQNAIMFNKHNTLVHKMTLEMQEECLQHMQVLVRAAGDASFRRETRTAASISNDTSDNSLKRKWSHITPSLHESESYRTKKRRKSEND